MFLFLATFVNALPRTLTRDMRIFILTILFTLYLLLVPFIGLYMVQERVYAKIEASRPTVAFDLR